MTASDQLDLPGFVDFTVVAQTPGAVVYRAQQAGVDRQVAIKVRELAGAEAVAQFQRGVEVAAKLGQQHPYISTVIATGVVGDGRPYVVTEFYDGGSLHDRLRASGGVRPENAITAGAIVADALAFAHQQGIVHGGIKPQNVLVMPTACVVTDFGTSRRVDPYTPEWFAYRHAAPQVLDGETPEPVDDVWSLGALLFTMLDGRPPFAWENDEAGETYLRRVRNGPRRPLRAGEVPAGLVAIVDRCLQADRSDRFPDAASLRDALSEVGLGAALARPEPGGTGEQTAVIAGRFDADPSGDSRSQDSLSHDSLSHDSLSQVALAEWAAAASSHHVTQANRSAAAPTDDQAARTPRPRSTRILINVVITLVVGALVGLAASAVAGRINSATGRPLLVASAPAAPTGTAKGSGGNNPSLAPAVSVPELTGSGVMVRWRDATDSQATFIVVRVIDGRGRQVRALPAGVTEVLVDDLDPRAPPYCFLVIAVVGQERGVSPTRCIGDAE